MVEICTSSMILLPSRNGYSHQLEEFTASEDVEKGVTVLATLSTQTTWKDF